MPLLTSCIRQLAVKHKPLAYRPGTTTTSRHVHSWWWILAQLLHSAQSVAPDVRERRVGLFKEQGQAIVSRNSRRRRPKTFLSAHQLKRARRQGQRGGRRRVTRYNHRTPVGIHGSPCWRVCYLVVASWSWSGYETWTFCLAPRVHTTRDRPRACSATAAAA